MAALKADVSLVLKLRINLLPLPSTRTLEREVGELFASGSKALRTMVRSRSEGKSSRIIA